MKTEKTKHAVFSTDFKLEVLTYYYSHEVSVNFTSKKFGVSRSSIRDWEKDFELDGNLLSLSQDLITKVEIMRQKKELRKLANPPKSENDILREQNARLKKALEYSELRNEALMEVLKIGKEEYGLDLLKKAGVKQ